MKYIYYSDESGNIFKYDIKNNIHKNIIESNEGSRSFCVVNDFLIYSDLDVGSTYCCDMKNDISYQYHVSRMRLDEFKIYNNNLFALNVDDFFIFSVPVLIFIYLLIYIADYFLAKKLNRKNFFNIALAPFFLKIFTK